MVWIGVFIILGITVSCLGLFVSLDKKSIWGMFVATLMFVLGIVAMHDLVEVLGSEDPSPECTEQVVEPIEIEP